MIKYLLGLILVLFLTASCDSLPAFVINLPIGGDRAADGQQGPPGAAGVDGERGLDCWDLNRTGICEGQDRSGPDGAPDGWCDAWDCQGPAGEPGTNGTNGVDGVDGTDGQDGADGRNGVVGRNGQDGQDGSDGEDGQDGSGPCPNGNPHGPCDG